jgi:predicted NBD/HSP70 family sugar kinase
MIDKMNKSIDKTKTNIKKGTTLLSTMNKNAILTFLRTNGPCSRADLVRELHLSFPAVSSNVKCLLEMNLIYEAGEGNNVIGRKSTLLTFNANQAFLLGIDIGRSHIRVMCSNISGEIKSYESTETGEGDIFQVILLVIKTAIQKAGVTMKAIACIGVGIPGIYNEKTNTHLLAPFVEGWNAADLFPRLRNYFSEKIMFFENSVNLGAIGEWWKGCAHDYDNVVYMEFGVGIGASILQNGKILYGENGAAGEMGYMVVESSTLRDEFENEGALEKLIPSRFIGYYIDKRTEEGQGDINLIMEDLKKEYPACRIDQVVKYFAMSIINTVAVINPKIVVISGRLGISIYSLYGEEIRRLIKVHVPFPPIIACSILGEKANVMGTIALAQEYVIKDYETIGDF